MLSIPLRFQLSPFLMCVVSCCFRFTLAQSRTRLAFRQPAPRRVEHAIVRCVRKAPRFQQIAWRSWTRSAQPLPCKRVHVQGRLGLGSKRSDREKDRRCWTSLMAAPGKQLPSDESVQGLSRPRASQQHSHVRTTLNWTDTIIFFGGSSVPGHLIHQT